MTPSIRLGGFKVLKGMARFSIVLPKGPKYSPAQFCRLIADKKINLAYFTCVHAEHSWGMNIMVDAVHGLRISLLIEENFGKVFSHASDSAILSLFPHKKNPDITGRLFELFSHKGVKLDALANSPSAISIVLEETYLDRAGKALFEPFSFSAYRTPCDWKLAQEGKEQLYKDVVASYQEQRPKVYGLEYHDIQELVWARWNNRSIGHFSAAFKEFARLDLDLTFSVSGPCREEEKRILAFCLPGTEKGFLIEIINRLSPETDIDSASPVGIFSMTGPHFGDRYGIVSELLTSFEKNRIDLLGLSCTIASITGVVPSRQLEPAIQAIQECFEVPTIIKRDN